MRLLSLFIVILAVMAAALLPLGMALAQEANPGRVLPDAVHKGETFDVSVTFTSPADELNSVGLTDLCPDAWEVTLDEAWCTPDAEFVNPTGNKAEIMWFGPYESGTTFTALYKVTVPDDAELGIYAFNGFLEYYLEEEPYSENITGGSQVEVVAGSVIGVWWIVGIVVGIAVIVAAALLVRRRRA